MSIFYYPQAIKSGYLKFYSPLHEYISTLKHYKSFKLASSILLVLQKKQNKQKPLGCYYLNGILSTALLKLALGALTN